MYICTHASTSETTAQQRLHGKPDLTPRSSALLPVRCNPEGYHPSWPAAQLPVHKERQISAEQPQPTALRLIAPSRQRAVQTTSAYLHWCGADPPSSWPTQAASLAVAPRNEVIFLPCWRFFFLFMYEHQVMS